MKLAICVGQKLQSESEPDGSLSLSMSVKKAYVGSFPWVQVLLNIRSSLLLSERVSEAQAKPAQPSTSMKRLETESTGWPVD